MAGSATIMSAIQTLLQALSTFADADVTQGDYTILSSGSAPYAVILPGGFDVLSVSDDGAEAIIRWRHTVEVIADYRFDDNSGLVSARQAVITQLAKYPTLNDAGGILRARVDGGGDPRYLYPPGGDTPHFILASVEHVSDEHVQYTGGEH